MIGIVFVLCSVWLESFGQVCLKKSATTGNSVRWKHYWTISGIALFGAEALIWTLALHKIDVSIAYPMGSLSFVTIALLSQLWLKEKVTRQRWLGLVLIISGASLIGIS